MTHTRTKEWFTQALWKVREGCVPQLDTVQAGRHSQGAAVRTECQRCTEAGLVGERLAEEPDATGVMHIEQAHGVHLVAVRHCFAGH